MVLVRLRLEKANGEVKYHKPLITLPGNVPIAELCNGIIGEKLGVAPVEWKDYSVYEATHDEKEPPKMKLNTEETFLQTKTKNGIWLLVRSNHAEPAEAKKKDNLAELSKSAPPPANNKDLELSRDVQLPPPLQMPPPEIPSVTPRKSQETLMESASTAKSPQLLTTENNEPNLEFLNRYSERFVMLMGDVNHTFSMVQTLLEAIDELEIIEDGVKGASSMTTRRW